MIFAVLGRMGTLVVAISNRYETTPFRENCDDPKRMLTTVDSPHRIHAGAFFKFGTSGAI